MRLGAAGAAIVFVVALPRFGAACVCDEIRPFDDVARHPKEVVVAEVVRQGAGGPGAGTPFAMEVRVLQVLKGTPPRRFKIWGGFSSCHPSVKSFEVGSIWAFVLLPGEEPSMRYVLHACVESTRRLPANPAARARDVATIRVKAGIQ